MTHHMTGPSLKHDAAIRYGRALERAMRKRDVGSRVVAEAARVGRGSVQNWRQGRNLPRIETARRLAEALETPQLEAMAIRLRTKACLVCETEYVDDSGSDNRRYCSTSCRHVAQEGRVGQDKRQRAGRAEMLVTKHERAVAAYCEGCEPQGRCVTPECDLRPVSPMPLYESRIETETARARPHNGYREPGADSARMRGIWAAYTPEQRAARVGNAAAVRHGLERAVS